MGSSERGNTDFSFDARLRDLEAVTERTGLDRFALWGRTQGGPATISYAVKHPDRVSGLVLVATYEIGADYYQSVPAWRMMQGAKPMAEEEWEYYTLALANAVTGFSDSALASRWAAAFRAGMSASAYLSYREASEKLDVTELLPLLNVPTLVLHVPSDPQSNVDLLRVLASRIPNARLISTEDGAQAIDAFLRDGEEGTAPARSPSDALPSRGRKAGASRTIIYTDIEGNTDMLQRLGDDAWRAVLRDHERITRELLRAHGGTEVKTMGDGFMASFDSSTNAVECAIDLQRSFAARNTTAAEPLLVRVGLNAGEPIEEDDPDGRVDLFGTAVTMAARIMGQGAGGEILVSEVVRGLVAGKGFVFADRGEFTAKGFEEPVRVYEVRWRE